MVSAECIVLTIINIYQIKTREKYAARFTMKKPQLELLPCICMHLQTSQVAVTVYIHVCVESCVAIRVDNASNVSAKKQYILKRGCFTHIFPPAA